MKYSVAYLLLTVASLIIINATAALAVDYYVDARWGRDVGGNGDTPREWAWHTITYALENAEPSVWDPAVVHVAPGRYSTTSNGETLPLVARSNLLVLGERQSETIIDGEGASELVRCRDVTAFALEDVTLTRGAHGALSCENSNIRIARCLVTCDAGMGAVISAERSSLTIDRCGVSGNNITGEYSETPICLYQSDTSISDSSISDNQAGGVTAYNGSLVMHCCALEDSTGGATLNFQEVPEAWITDCVIRGNTWSGGEFGDSCVECCLSTVHLLRCVVSENSAFCGAIGYSYGEGSPSVTRGLPDASGYVSFDTSPTGVDIQDSLICGNQSCYGGPIMCTNLTGPLPMMPAKGLNGEPSLDYIVSVKRCTIVGNRASADHADNPCVFTYVDGARFEDDIVVGNDGSLFSKGENSNQVSYCCLQEEYEGEANFVADPLFVAGPLGDYYLSATAAGQAADSPCIDAGSTSARLATMSSLTTRTDGAFDTGIVDIGYHYSATPPTIQASVANLTNPSVPAIPHFAPGETLSASVAVENGGLPLWVDIYAAFILPDGALFCIAPGGLTTDLVPWAATSLLRTDFASGDIVVFQAQLPEGLPQGTYTFAAALSLTGEFRPIGDIAFSQFTVGS